MWKRTFARVSAVGFATGFGIYNTKTAFCHCQVPCGIYDDEGRISQLREDLTTITKAIKNIGSLSGSHSPDNVNQLVRWINVKEEHASHIITTVAEYFLTQKVKTVDQGSDGYEDYLAILEAHHRVMKAAMVCKQKPTEASVHGLQHALDDLAKIYTPH